MNQTADVETYVKTYFKDTLPSGDMSASFRELAIDSLDLAEFIMDIEEKYSVDIDPADLDKDMTLSRFCDIVNTSKTLSNT